MLRQNGLAIVPLMPSKKDKSGLLPDRHITVWPYSDLSDKRLLMKDDCILLKQRPETEKPIKIGSFANPSWIAYWVDCTVFIKEFSEVKGTYPDFGCSVEVFANSEMLELETIGPLGTINPLESVIHTEYWRVFNVNKLVSESHILNKLVALLNNQ